MNTIDIERPDPDELLASVIREEQKSRCGLLKIFFGMCAGVGKTYAMLQTAKMEKLKGNDFVIGYVETHNRPETSALAEGFELIPRKQTEYKSTTIEEMDLDLILSRKPQYVLVDELAHTNAPGSRHKKRFQDVLEILEHGINVYTTLNVQHLESRSETVAQITGIVVRETIPDEIFEKADEIELVDLTPDELLQRFSEGKVYTAERSKEAVENFFRKGNITALREMALRIVADRVDKQLHDYMQKKQIRGPWKTGAHLLVAVNYHPQSARLLRWAKNLSYSMGADVQAVYIERLHKLTIKENEQLNRNINLAKQLGIQFRIITNTDLVRAIVGFAQKENVTHIIIGKPRSRNLFPLFGFGNFVNRLIRFSGNIDVYVVGSDKTTREYINRISKPVFTSNLRQYVVSAALVVLLSIMCYQLKNIFEYQIVSFFLLFLVSILALFFGTGPILLAATLSALIWDYYFMPPQFTFRIEKPEDVLMFTTFFIIALLNGILTSRVRRQEKKIRIREERTYALYQLTKELNSASGVNDVTQIAVKYLHKYFRLDCAIILKNDTNQLDFSITHITDIKPDEIDRSIAEWVFRHSVKAGKNSDTLPSGLLTYYPLTGNNTTMGVIAIKPDYIFTQGEEEFWHALISQISGKFEREILRNTARIAFAMSESEKLLKTLYNSVSHELRIPVSTILGATDTLLMKKHPQEIQDRLLSEINIASIRLNQLIDNLLNMSRLESGSVKPHYDWCDVHDLAVKVSEKLKDELHPFHFSVVIPQGMPLVYIDFGIMEQVLFNLLLNATQHSPAGTSIRLKSFYDNGRLVVQLMDRGKGFQEEELPLIFNKFYRGKQAGTGGTGLGLSIVKGFVEALGGTITAENRKNGGAVFTLTLPVKASEIKVSKSIE
jgi:two-component system, OmpR family, sensor histidine kinase KdpD